MKVIKQCFMLEYRPYILSHAVNFTELGKIASYDKALLYCTNLGFAHHNNAVAESFFSLLKTERIKRKVYKTRNEARSEIFNYIEFFYNPTRRHGNNDGVSPIEYEKQYFEKLLSV